METVRLIKLQSSKPASFMFTQQRQCTFFPCTSFSCRAPNSSFSIPSQVTAPHPGGMGDEGWCQELLWEGISSPNSRTGLSADFAPPINVRSTCCSSSSSQKTCRRLLAQRWLQLQLRLWRACPADWEYAPQPQIYFTCLNW